MKKCQKRQPIQKKNLESLFPRIERRDYTIENSIFRRLKNDKNRYPSIRQREGMELKIPRGTKS